MYTDLVLQTGHFNPAVMDYHNWPGTSILTTALVDIFGWHHADSLLPIIGITPLVGSFLSLPLLYIFLRNMIGKGQDNYCWAGIWLFNVGYCLEILMFAPHGFGFLLFLAVLALFSVSVAREGGITVFSHRLVTILIFAALVITHVFSSLVGFIYIIACYVTKKISLTWVIIAAVFIVGWTIYGAAYYFTVNLPTFVNKVFILDELWSSGVSGRFVGSPAHQNIVLIRIATQALFLVIGIIGGILSRKVKWGGDKTALIMSAGVLVFTGVMGMGYGGELPMRLFQILLPLIAYFGVKLLNYKATAFILCAVLVLVLPFQVTAKYGNHYTEYRSPAYFSGVNFFFDHITEGYVIFDSGSEQLTEIRYTPYHRLGFSDIVWGEDSIYHHGMLLTPAAYIAIANDEKYYDYILGDPESFTRIEESLNGAKNCNFIYMNPDLQYYYLIPP